MPNRDYNWRKKQEHKVKKKKIKTKNKKWTDEDCEEFFKILTGK